ncbi:uncharacterized protein BHQ10_001498 [Talaromyces amestolkiae]|uniref:Uncharacterized protein n=1 Tax=Talaromyces amestolkiae TaxID=1196081 RepID=A0A364KPK2_TALAM|nr:uncharacterized protein BHQ10_001498 [Talaromyces amestolkiae]RAO65486.1 hypothetical protein BHQ10_001498 [Talaromyces amestolkiae]
MVSAKALLALYAIAGIVQSYPIHRPIEGLSEPHLTSRSPSPRFRNPFDVDSYLRNLDYKIPNNKSVQQWVKAARKKGALAAAGKFSGDDDDDDDDKHEDKKDHDNDDDDDEDKKDKDNHDHDHDDDKHHKTKGTPRVNGEKDSDHKDDHDHHQHAAQSASKPDDKHDDEHDDDDDDDDDKDDVNNVNKDEVAQPARPTPTSTPKTADSTVTSTPKPNQEGDEANNIEVMQPNDTQDAATPTIPSNTVSEGNNAAAPAVQTVYVPVNVFPTRFPNFPDIDDDEKPSPSSTPLPIFPPPDATTKANLPPTDVSHSPKESANTNGAEVSEAPVAEDATNTPDVTDAPEVVDAPMNEEPTSDNVDPTNTFTPTPQMPSHEAQLSKISELLDMFTPKDKSDPSY